MISRLFTCETEEEEDAAFEAFEKHIEENGDYGAKKCLALGVPIYYTTEGIPKGLTIKEYPSGKKELVVFSSGKEAFIKKYEG
ncbi:TPA: hypothetical protein SI423_004566 [Escherichia coli]|nr:hypothetical protein [Escherichia coli]